VIQHKTCGSLFKKNKAVCLPIKSVKVKRFDIEGGTQAEGV
jgi:hypothetical protein